MLISHKESINMGKNRKELLERLQNMTDEELSLVVATGLSCDKCPAKPTCYDKVVYIKNIIFFIQGE